MKDKKELWQTMEEPDIDPLMAEGLCSNPKFQTSWIHRFYPDVQLAKLHKVKPNDWREEWTKEVGRRRETDLHVEFEDTQGKRHVILTESKVVAPAGYKQPEDYSAYAYWGKRNAKWQESVTVLMAPKGYLESNQSVHSYDQNITYEKIEEVARNHGLNELSDYLRAGIIRQKHCSEPRNPDETIGSFRVKYGDLLRDECRDIYMILSANSKKLFDKSQTWFEYNLSDTPGDQIIHKISNNRTKPQNAEDTQYLSLHAHGMMNRIKELPDLDLPGKWRATKAYAIKDIPLERDSWMSFDAFETNKARHVWRLLETVRHRWTQFRNISS